MGLDRALQGGLDPGCPLFGVGTEEDGPYLETPGPGHGRVQESQVPQRHPTPIKLHDRRTEVPRVPEEGRYRHVATRTSRREPHPYYQVHAASGSHEVPQGFAAFDGAPFAASSDGLDGEHVLKQQPYS
jgi:hypothetical protein